MVIIACVPEVVSKQLNKAFWSSTEWIHADEKNDNIPALDIAAHT